MKAITLHQPWASFMAAGLKKVETRSWATSYTGWVAIHAGKTAYDPEYVSELLEDACEEIAGEEWDARLGDGRLRPWPGRLPLGAIVAVGYLLECRRTEDLVGTQLGTDRPLGNYEPRRFGWLFDPIIPCPTPIPCRGFQQLWEVPAEIEAQLRELIENHEALVDSLRASVGQRKGA